MATYNIDPAHSEVTFKIKHLMIANVTGNFQKFSGTLESSADDFSDAVINFEADIDSISTNNEQRDGHLKSAEFFDAAQYPKLTFQSTSLQKVSGEEYVLNGNLTLRDVTKPVTLEVEFGGLATDFFGQSRAGFEIAGKINRKDFGLTWNGVTEAGGIVVSDEVKLNLNIQVIKQA